MRKNIREIGVFNSVYSLFVYLLIKKGEINETLFYFWNDIPEEIACNFNFIRNRDALRGNNLIHSIIIFNYYRFKFYLDFITNRYWGVPVWGQDHIPIGRYFLEYTNNTFFVIEDGEANYSECYSKYGNKLIRKLLGLPYLSKFGHSKKVKEIYLTSCGDKIPYDIARKVSWISIVEEWGALDERTRRHILSIFKLPNMREDNITIILTQPFEEEGVCTEEYKIKFVHDIIERYELSNYYLKPHYREATNYETIVSKDKIMAKYFPFELLLLLNGDKINRVFTLSPNTTPIRLLKSKYNYINIEVVDIMKSLNR